MRFLCAAQPERVGAEGQWQALAVGGGHTCALDRPGRLHCWGSNRYGQLGGAAPETCRGIDGASPCRRRPAPVPGMGDVAGGVRAVAAGASHTCVLDGDGRAPPAGGSTRSARPVRRQATSSTSPTAVATDLRFSRLVAGAYHTCGITAGGALHCWGSDVAGELRGRAGDRCRDGPCAARPVRVAGSGVADAAAGFGITCMRRRDGVMRCWGRRGPERSGKAGGGPEPAGGPRRGPPHGGGRALAFRGGHRRVSRNVVEPLERAL
jgi:alpha-tubulin suppressor-like RCC1 family protein